MYPLEKRLEAKALAELGLNHCQISRNLDIPRSTVREWLLNQSLKPLLAKGPGKRSYSDGCRFTSTGRCNWSNPRYGFDNLSQDILDIFCGGLKKLKVDWTSSQGENHLRI